MTLKNILLNSEARSLNDDELRNITMNPKLQVISYHALRNKESLLEIFNQSGDKFILLFESQYNSGHYVSIIFHRSDNIIYFYDSYGKDHDSLIAKLHYYVDDGTGEYFFNRLYRNMNKVYHTRLVFNRTPYQKLKNNINTCGRYACVRYRFAFLNNQQFNSALFSNNFKNLSSDEIVTMLTLLHSSETDTKLYTLMN